MTKLLHIADLHLDSPFVGLNPNDASKRRKELREVFKNALDYARNTDCALILISGDLFDGEYYTLDTLSYLRECFAQMPTCRFVIAPGNHDPLSPTSPYKYANFPKNVFMFDSEQLSYFDFDDLGITVYGYAFRSDYYGLRPLSDISALPETRNFKILCAHTELDAHISKYAPILSSELARLGFDYAALGHIHKSDGVKRVGNTLYAYSGCIAGRDFSETGEKGGIVVSLDEASKTVTAEQVRFCPWVYDNMQVNVNGLPTLSAVIDAVQIKLLTVKGNPQLEYILRLVLTGETTASIDKNELLRRFAEYGVCEIKDETHFMSASLNLADDYSLRGELYRALKERLEGENTETRKQAELALKYGLSALGAGDIEI